MESPKSSVSKTTVIIFLIIAVFANAMGNVCLSYGMKALGTSTEISMKTLYQTLRRALDQPTILWGIVLLIIFFGLFLLLLSWADLSFVLPLLSSSYVVNTILAHYILHEAVSLTRWLGVVAICVGAYYISTTLVLPEPPREPKDPVDVR